MHAHWMPSVLSAALRARKQPPRIRPNEAGEEVLDNGGTRMIRLPEGFDDDVATRLAKMNETGISHGLLSLATQYHIEWLPIEESLPLCRAFNDAVSVACAAHPDRFSGLAILPVKDLDAAADEFARAMDLPGMAGALLIGDGFLSVQRAQRYRRIFELADRRNAILFVHYGHLPDDPGAPALDTSDNAYVRMVTLDFQQRLSSNMVTFCLTDFLKDYPNVTVMSHNLGGNIPFEIERMDHRSLIDQPKGSDLPSKRFRDTRILVDCNSLGQRAIELAAEVYGADKIVLGSDGSMFGARWSLDAIAKARIPEADKQAILTGNAETALRRVVRNVSAAA